MRPLFLACLVLGSCGAFAQLDNPGEVAAITAAPTSATASRAKVKMKDGAAPMVSMFSSTPTLKKSIYVYADGPTTANTRFPALLENALFYELPSTEQGQYEVVTGGDAYALARVNEVKDETAAMSALNFQRVDGAEPFQLFGDKAEDVFAVFHKKLAAGETFALPAGSLLVGIEVIRPEFGGEALYNGIRLPRAWPPAMDLASKEPMPVPYLTHPPKLIPIDVGRQLFVDDFLVESTDLTREYHYPVKYEGNPVLKPETPAEINGHAKSALAGPKSGGLWWNPEKQVFELWYEAGWVSTICYATSKDGIHWDRPDLKVVKPGTNIVLPKDVNPDSWTVVRDYRNTDPKEQFKFFICGYGARERARYFLSGDGLEWGTVANGGICGDRSTMFYNPFRKKWVYSLRWNSPGGRSRYYWEGDDFVGGMNWMPDDPIPWARADKLDKADPKIGETPQLYNLDAVAYESIMLGFFEITYGPNNDVAASMGLPKITGLNFAYSRDGYHFSRPDRTMDIMSENRDGTWDRGYVQSLGNLCVVRGDTLWFYYIGFAGDKNKLWHKGEPGTSMDSGMYANGATGVATLRRDGFVSLNAGAAPATITTRPVTFSGKYLFANVDAPKGQLVAEVVDMSGKVIEPFSFANGQPLTGDTTLAQLKWKGGDDLSALDYRAVRFRFRVTNGKFYSFWVSRDTNGRSDGYVAGGGPGFTCDVDTVGKGSLEAEAKVKAAR